MRLTFFAQPAIVALVFASCAAPAEAGSRDAGAAFTPVVVHEAGGPVYGLERGEFDELHDGDEVACLYGDGSVLQLSPDPGAWTASVLAENTGTIFGMGDRPTIAIGDVHSSLPGNEIIIAPGRDVIMVFRDPVSGWLHEAVFDATGMGGTGWGARVGDVDPLRPGDEIFHIYEGYFDISSGTVFCEVDGAWEDEFIYEAEVGMDSAVGEFNPTHPGPEIVVVTEMGPAYEILRPQGQQRGEWPKQIIWDDFENAGWVTAIADVDPTRPGNEIVYGTRYSNSIMLSWHAGPDGHHLEILFTGIGGIPSNMWDIAVGEVLPESATLEILGVDETGSVYLVRRQAGVWQGEIIWQSNEDPLYAVVTGDFVPARAGEEILVAGESGAITLLTELLLGDLDGDWDIDLSDLAILLSNYGLTSGMTYEDGDIDGDGDVDIADLSALLAVYGTTCD